MTIERQVKDAIKIWNHLMRHPDADISYQWFRSLPIMTNNFSDDLLEKTLLEWIPESHINDYTSGFIIQNKAVFDKWYEQLKLNSQNDTTTTNSIT